MANSIRPQVTREYPDLYDFRECKKHNLSLYLEANDTVSLTFVSHSHGSHSRMFAELFDLGDFLAGCHELSLDFRQFSDNQLELAWVHASNTAAVDRLFVARETDRPTSPAQIEYSIGTSEIWEGIDFRIVDGGDVIVDGEPVQVTRDPSTLPQRPRDCTRFSPRTPRGHRVGGR